jgi:hypothetical protein
MSGSIGDNPYRASGVIAAAAAGGGVSWQDVITASTFTAVAGNGYPVNTTSNACTVTLPASASVGDEIIFTDYLRTWATNNLTINQNSLKFQGNASPNPVYAADGESVHIVYVDATQGWVPTYDGAVSFETSQTYDAEYLAVAGGGAGGYPDGNGSAGVGGGGAGGLLTNYEGTAISLTPSEVYTITVGEGGGADISGGNNGENSVISGTGITTITAVGGGVGGGNTGQDCAVGGSGGGTYAPTSATGCAGTAGPPRQGYAAGDAPGSATSGSGGGGAGAVGSDTVTPNGGPGGAGAANSITGSSVTYAGGGGGGGTQTPAAGGSGGGGEGGTYYLTVDAADPGTDGLGGGGGGGNYTTSPTPAGADGGNGIVILRMADARAAAGTAANEDSTATDVGGSGETVITWLVDGTWTA